MTNSKKNQEPDETPATRKRRIFFTGLTMGTADLVPGVSGGTIAFLFGIYDELLYSIKVATGPALKLIFTGKFKAAFKLMPFAFLVPLLLGMLLAIFGMVQIVNYLLETFPTFVWSLFFGLVAGSVYVILRRLTQWTPKRILLLILGFVLTFILVGLPSIGGSDSPLAIFSTGAVAITAMILPGISGSMIMVILGQYEIVINAVADRNLGMLAIFAAGIFVGIATFVRVLSWLLKRYHQAVMAFLIGVMAGSLRSIWPWQTESSNGTVSNVLPQIDLALAGVLLLMLFGFGLVILLERVGVAREHDDIDTPEFRKEMLEFEN